ncbi:hypothetical protein I7I53_07094 [Histoplasma capsulatum var. duboisii H88]|uniref:Uncharacterized protein n=1 Tax=Ajellomyces capsulatus (strain H88) TaxID=544711 RepID=A0A8A1LDR6_AJEC8|nr:hypothetical protein I7I53_07094 [Histoplasma capsulatum var. duboisii H88]
MILSETTILSPLSFLFCFFFFFPSHFFTISAIFPTLSFPLLLSHCSVATGLVHSYRMSRSGRLTASQPPVTNDKRNRQGETSQEMDVFQV